MVGFAALTPPYRLCPVASVGWGERSEPHRNPVQSNGTINNATIFMILIKGLMAGPAVSL